MSEISKRKTDSGPSISNKKRKKGDLRLPQYTVPKSIDTLEQLIEFVTKYRGNNVDQIKLYDLYEPLLELDDLIGMKDLKKEIVHLIKYYLHGLQSKNDLLHTVICGPPGAGKTSVVTILAKIYCALGALPSTNIVKATRTDFIGKYTGHSEHKTKEKIEEAFGGVLLIDEASNMGSNRDDSFSKAALDTLNQHLTEYKDKFVCIIAGYEEELEQCFFKVNQGLKRRFSWRFKIEKYNSKELSQIFWSMIVKEGWWCDVEISDFEKFFSENYDQFPFAGGDIEVFFCKCKIIHTSKVFATTDKSKIISKNDMDNAFDLYISNRKETKKLSNHMYI